MNTREYTDQQTKECREHWFKNHKAEVMTQDASVTVIKWENPETWNYGCRFIIHRRWLTVVGDIGEAVYEWGQDLDLNFLGKLHLGYFMEKCCASEKGTEFDSWDSQVAFHNLSAFLSEQDEEDPPGEEDKDYRSHLRNLTARSAKDEYQEAATEIYNESGDAELASMITGFGTVPNCRAIGHWVGITMVAEQLLK